MGGGGAHQSVRAIHISFKVGDHSIFPFLEKSDQLVWTVIHKQDQYFFVPCPVGAEAHLPLTLNLASKQHQQVERQG